MGFTPGGSPKGGPLFNNTPQTVADLNGGRAFTELVGNRKIGSSTERGALTGSNVWEGLEFWDTTLKAAFIYQSGGWVHQFSLTVPWTGLPYGSGWADYLSGFPVGQYAKDAAGNVHLRGQVRPRSGYGITEAMATLPPNCRPTAEIGPVPIINNGGAAPVVAALNIRTTGIITLSPPGVPAFNLGSTIFSTL